ncbi:MAG: hypothetical protein P4L74_03125 [Candidatus Doudnabacteria bacterium]|nr:hypothetical protein [Candidatus Doudnabacteria bacterium]
MIFWMVIIIIAVYFFLIFVVARLVVPFMGFGGYSAADALPPEIRRAISELENISHNQMSYLQAVYDLVLNKTLHQWKHTRFKAATHLPRAWVKDLSEIWNTSDFVYCTAINYVIFTMLVNSKYFRSGDIKVRHVFVNFFIHQYLQVNVGDNWIDVDPAGTGIRGKPLGSHLAWFG